MINSKEKESLIFNSVDDNFSIWPFSSFLSNRRLLVVLDGKSSQEYPVNAGVLQTVILSPTLFVLYINDLLDVICDIVIYADDTTLYFRCHEPSDL